MSQNSYSRIELEQTKLNLDSLSEIAKVLEVEAIDILKFDDQYIFNSISHNQTGGEIKTGVFEADDITEQLREEIKYLREENSKLLSSLEKR